MSTQGKGRGKERTSKGVGTSAGKRTKPAEPAGQPYLRAQWQQIQSTLQTKTRENREALTYVSLFLGLCIAFYLLYYYLAVHNSPILASLNTNIAWILGAVFSAGGASVVRNGAVVTIDGFSLEIIDECTAVFSSIVYCACILAYPTTVRNKGLGVAFGIPALYAINILRLVVITFVGLSAPQLFDFVHVYLWQASFIIFVVIIFLLWLKLIVK
jgi:archaeosortase B (VPXXXP-CTERM-specific)